MSNRSVLGVYSIGDLAQLGGVTTRMLRHYHDLGVLVPAVVDRSTGYRRYEVSQLGDLLQVLALKGLGFSLSDIKRLMESGVSPAELRGMLLLRRNDVQTELREATALLARVESHIQRLENQMQSTRPPQPTVTTKQLPAVHLAIASATSPSFASADIGPAIKPLYPRLLEALSAAGVEILGPSIAFYDDAPDGGVGVHAGFPIAASVTQVAGLDVVDLAAVDLAAAAIHQGDMASVDIDTVAPLFEWINAHGFRTTGYSREVYLECPDDVAQWRTEMQFPIETDPSR